MTSILIVEDDITYGMMLKTWLGKKGFQVTSASNIARAQKHIDVYKRQVQNNITMHLRLVQRTINIKPSINISGKGHRLVRDECIGPVSYTHLQGLVRPSGQVKPSGRSSMDWNTSSQGIWPSYLEIILSRKSCSKSLRITNTSLPKPALMAS